MLRRDGVAVSRWRSQVVRAWRKTNSRWSGLKRVVVAATLIASFAIGATAAGQIVGGPGQISPRDSFAPPKVSVSKASIGRGATRVTVRVKWHTEVPADLHEVSVCLSAPRKAFTGSACKGKPDIAPGQSQVTNFKVRSKQAASTGHRYKIKLRVIAQGVSPVNRQIFVRAK